MVGSVAALAAAAAVSRRLLFAPFRIWLLLAFLAVDNFVNGQVKLFSTLDAFQGFFTQFDNDFVNGLVDLPQLKFLIARGPSPVKHRLLNIQALACQRFPRRACMEQMHKAKTVETGSLRIVVAPVISNGFRPQKRGGEVPRPPFGCALRRSGQFRVHIWVVLLYLGYV